MAGGIFRSASNGPPGESRIRKNVIVITQNNTTTNAIKRRTRNVITRFHLCCLCLPAKRPIACCSGPVSTAETAFLAAGTPPLQPHPRNACTHMCQFNGLAESINYGNAISAMRTAPPRSRLSVCARGIAVCSGRYPHGRTPPRRRGRRRYNKSRFQRYSEMAASGPVAFARQLPG